MFVGIGVKLNLDRFIADCKQRFSTFESDFNQFMINCKFEDFDDAITQSIEFINKQLNKYLNSYTSKQVYLYEWLDHPVAEESKYITIVLGYTILQEENDSLMKFTSLEKVNACIEDLKVVLKQLEISEDKIELIADRQ